MTLLVDTSVWSLAFRRDSDGSSAEVLALRQALEGGDLVVTTGLILQELIQGFSGPRASKILSIGLARCRFSARIGKTLLTLRNCAINAVVPACKPVRSMRYWRSCATVMGWPCLRPTRILRISRYTAHWCYVNRRDSKRPAMD